MVWIMRKERGRLPPPEGATPRPGKFLHGVDIGDFYPCWNLAATGALWSMDYTELSPGYVYESLRDVPIERLSTGPLTTPTGTPRGARAILDGAAARGALLPELPGALARVQQLSDEERASVLRVSDAEIAFESARRRIAPSASSRLTSLWVAEDSEEGRELVRSMFSATYLLSVRVSAAIRMTRADPVWFELYMAGPSVEHADSYWLGLESETSRGWEYLVEGEIEATVADQLAYVQANGAHRQYLPGSSANHDE